MGRKSWSVKLLKIKAKIVVTEIFKTDHSTLVSTLVMVLGAPLLHRPCLVCARWVGP